MFSRFYTHVPVFVVQSKESIEQFSDPIVARFVVLNQDPVEILVNQTEGLGDAGQLSPLLGSHVGRGDDDQGFRRGTLFLRLFVVVPLKDWKSGRKIKYLF